MKVTCTGRRVTLKPSFIENAEKRLAKLDKFFPDEAQAQVTVTVEKSGQTVEIMLRSKDLAMRAEKTDERMEDALADAVDLRVGDVKAARGERGAVGLPLVDDDAGAQAQRFVEIAGAEIAHLLGGHDADGLRRFLDVQIQPGRPAAHPVLALLDNRHLLQRRLDGRTRLGPCGAHQGRLHDQRHECDGAHDGAKGMGVHGRQFPWFQQMGIIIISICKKHCRANAAPAAMHASELLFL